MNVISIVVTVKRNFSALPSHVLIRSQKWKHRVWMLLINGLPVTSSTVHSPCVLCWLGHLLLLSALSLYRHPHPHRQPPRRLLCSIQPWQQATNRRNLRTILSLDPNFTSSLVLFPLPRMPFPSLCDHPRLHVPVTLVAPVHRLLEDSHQAQRKVTSLCSEAAQHSTRSHPWALIFVFSELCYP